MKKSFTRLFFAAVITLVTVSAICAGEAAKPAKYVFLFIGDGLSIPQRMMAEEFARVTTGKGLFINRMDSQAITSTRSANSFITDSAASGTAIACGEKTYNGAIGIAADGKRHLVSSAKVAKASGRKVGIITSVTLNHATPAAFYGNNIRRGNYYQLGLDLIKAGFDYYGGGGISKHNDKKDPAYKGDIYDLAAKAGYKVCRSTAEIKALKPGDGRVIAIGSKGALPYAADKTANDLKLADFVKQGIMMLDNPGGFFMMAEGGAIDWLCHANDAAGTLMEILEFDKAVQAAYEFYLKHPADTLIVVTGDHETGGLTLGFAGTGYTSHIQLLAAQKCSSAKLNELWDKALDKKGKPCWETARKLITENTGLIFGEPGKAKTGNLYLTAREEKSINSAFRKQFSKGKGKNKRSTRLTTEVIRILNNKAAVAWTSGAHTALPVNTTAIGVNRELFSNMIDNTDIAKRIKAVLTAAPAAVK